MAKKILVVDDEPLILKMLRSRLVAQDYEVVEARDGKEALRKIVEEKPHLIVTDVMMPNMTGFEFIKALRSVGGTFKTVPVLVMSAKENMRAYFEDFDVVDFLNKPFDIELLLTKIEQGIQRQELAVPGEVKSKAPASITSKSNGSTRSAGKKIMIMGVEDFVIQKLTVFCESKKLEVVKALDIEDAVQTYAEEKPDFVLVQYWEDQDFLNVKEVFKRLSEVPGAQAKTFFAYCPERISLDALTSVKGARVIAYPDATKLLPLVANELKLTA